MAIMACQSLGDARGGVCQSLGDVPGRGGGATSFDTINTIHENIVVLALWICEVITGTNMC